MWCQESSGKGATPVSTEDVREERTSLNGGKREDDDMDKAIDQAFEAVIREDIEAGAKKQRKSEKWWE